MTDTTGVNPPPSEADRLSPDEDLRTRWLPSPEQIAAGVAALQTVPAEQRDTWMAVVALAQPGKTYGLWETGQPVVCLPGVWIGENLAGDSLMPLREARDAAEALAERWLDQQHLHGTTAYAVVYPDGAAAVFEGLSGIGGTSGTSDAGTSRGSGPRPGTQPD